MSNDLKNWLKRNLTPVISEMKDYVDDHSGGGGGGGDTNPYEEKDASLSIVESQGVTTITETRTDAVITTVIEEVDGDTVVTKTTVPTSGSYNYIKETTISIDQQGNDIITISNTKTPKSASA